MADGTDRQFEWPEAVWVEKGRGLAGYAPGYAADDETQTQLVEWGEAGRRRIIVIARVTENTPEAFGFVDTQGEAWRLRELTLERYREHVREHTMLKPDFETAAEMLETMRREW